MRAKGIKPIKVWEIHSWIYVSRRTCVIILLALALIVVLVYAYSLHATLKTAIQSEGIALPRHQLYGDPVVLEDIERDNYATVFPDVGDRILAAFAIPGRVVPNLSAIPLRERIKALDECREKDVVIHPDDPVEVGELKRIVQGMKDEFRWYVGDGQGTAETYLRRLHERQSEEVRIYERTLKELEVESDPKIRIERNAALRAMGLRTIPRLKKKHN